MEPADEKTMVDRSIEPLKFQRDLIGLSGLAREAAHAEWKDADRLIEDCWRAIKPSEVTASSH